MLFSDIEKYIDRFLKENSFKYKNTELISLLVTPIYLRLFTQRPAESKLKEISKKLIAKIFVISPKKIRIRKNFKNIKPDVSIVVSYDINNRNTPIVLPFSKLIPKNKILWITDKLSVYKYATQNKLNCVMVSSYKFSYTSKSKKVNATFQDQLNLSRGYFIYKYALKLLSTYKPKTLLTVQDFYLNDRVYTIAAQELKINTITHQHGLLTTDQNPFLYKYTISDDVMVWGEGSKRIFSKYLKNNNYL